MTTVDTTTTTPGYLQNQGRVVHRTSAGRLWVAFLSSNSIEFWYSDNDTTFTQNTSATISSAAQFDWAIDESGHAHIAWVPQAGGAINYQRMASISTSTSWASSIDVTPSSSSALFHPALKVHAEGSGWKAHLFSSVGSFGGVYWTRIGITSGGTPTKEASSAIDTVGAVPSVDFHHTGDGVTVKSSTPHLFVGYLRGAADLVFRKLTYSAGTWAVGTRRDLDTSGTKFATGVSTTFDGTRAVIAYAESASVLIAERDAADTTTTLRTPPALSDGTITNVAVTHDVLGRIQLIASGTTSDDVSRTTYNRTGASWDSWSTLATATVRSDELSVKPAYTGNKIDVAYLDDTGGSNSNVVHVVVQLNQAPTAPSWNNANNVAWDVAAALPLDWNHEDPDDGDTQSAYALSRQIGAAAVEYWNGSTWVGTEQKLTTSTTSVSIPSSWGADGDANHVYKVKTWDALDEEGVYSSGLTVIPSAKDNPTLTAPTDAGTTTTTSVTLTWTVSTQTAYRCRLLDASDNELEDTGKVTSTDLTYTFTGLDNSTTYKVEVRTFNDEGLESDTDTHTTTTSFTVGPTPTIVVTGQDATATIDVAITNPAPGGGEPNFSSNEVFVRVASGGEVDGERTVNDDGIRIAASLAEDVTFTDGEDAQGGPTHGVTYEYRVLANFDNGTAAYSAWTA